MAKPILVMAEADGSFTLNMPRSAVVKVHFADIDLVVKTTDGKYYVLPGAAMAAMESKPPRVKFQDTSESTDALLRAVQVVDDPSLNTQTKGSETANENDSDNVKPEDQDALKRDLDLARQKTEQQQKDLKALQEKLQNQKQIEANAKEMAAELKQATEALQSQEDQSSEAAVRQAENNAAEQMQEKIEKISESLHSKDYDYSPPRQFQAPPNPVAGPAGVPAPISMTPLVTLTMGNVVETTTISGSGTTTIYGGGGADGSSASSKIGPRDALQFSAATITGTSGNDIIYAEGPAVGNADPSLDTSKYAKEFLLRVAGYFTELNDVVIKGLPSYVTVQGGTLQADGSWVLPSSTVVSQQSFKLIYDKDAWRASGESRFDMTVVVSGMMRGTVFTSEEKFGFQFMDVTSVAQSTNPYLTFWDDGQSKQIYILPTQDQPNIINADAGDDVIYGGRSHDTIDAGDGADTVYAYDGDNVVTGGLGNDEIHTGSGNDVVSAGTGDNIVVDTGGTNTVTAGDGNNTVTMGSGDDVITVGNGVNVINAGDGANIIIAGDGGNTITTGSGGDQITTGAGNDIIHAGDGNNIISAGAGNNEIISGTGNDQILAGDGNNTIDAGDGNNTIAVGAGVNIIVTGSGADTITAGAGGNTIHAGDGADAISAGAGNDLLYGEAGNDTLHGGLGTNTIDGGTGTNTADYAGIGVGIVASLLTNTATGTGLSDTLLSIHNITGTSNADTLTGSAGDNILSGGAGDDAITGSGGNDTLYGGDGADTITGGSGLDIIYGDAGNDTINGGGAGNDMLYGGDGDDIFLNASSGQTCSGGAGTDKLDLSTQTASLTIDLGAGGAYVSGTQIVTFDSIEWVVTGSGSDTLTGGAGNDILDGGSGQDYLRGGLGSNTLIGGSGNSYYYMGYGYDYVVGSASWDQVEYWGSPAAVVVNLDSVTHSFVNVNGVTINVAAQSATTRGETLADNGSWAIGDTFSTSIDYLYTTNYNDVLFGSAAADQFMAQGGDDVIYAYAGNDFIYHSVGNDRVDGGDGNDRYCTTWYGNNMTVYLDGTADINANGTADYLERGASTLLTAGYTGFAYGTGLSGVSFIMNFEHLIGGNGNDYFVGDNNANEINAQTGNNTIYGLGGDDLIFAHIGNNTIDGGLGTDTVSFRNEGYTGGYGYNSATSVEIYLTDADLNSDGTMDRAGTWGSYQTYTARANLSGAYSYDTITNVENINGTINADKIAGNSGVNTIRGDSGDDFITGNGGADLLYGDAGNDTFVISSSDMSTVSLISGGSNTDTIKSAGWNYTSGSFTNSKYANIEAIDVRNSAGGGICSINATDIQSIVDSGASSVLQLYLDSGDTLSCVTGAGTGSLSILNTTHTATDDVYKFYSDAGHVVNNSTNLVAILNVHYGA